MFAVNPNTTKKWIINGKQTNRKGKVELKGKESMENQWISCLEEALHL